MLHVREGKIDDEVEETTWYEEWEGGDESCTHFQPIDTPADRICRVCGSQLMKRDVKMKLKKMPVFADGSVAGFTF